MLFTMKGKILLARLTKIICLNSIVRLQSLTYGQTIDFMDYAEGGKTQEDDWRNFNSENQGSIGAHLSDLRNLEKEFRMHDELENVKKNIEELNSESTLPSEEISETNYTRTEVQDTSTTKLATNSQRTTTYPTSEEDATEFTANLLGDDETKLLSEEPEEQTQYSTSSSTRSDNEILLQSDISTTATQAPGLRFPQFFVGELGSEEAYGSIMAPQSRFRPSTTLLKEVEVHTSSLLANSTLHPFLQQSVEETRTPETEPREKPSSDATIAEEMQTHYRYRPSTSLMKEEEEELRNSSDAHATECPFQEMRAPETVHRKKPISRSTTTEEIQQQQHRYRYRPATSVINEVEIPHAHGTGYPFSRQSVKEIKSPDTVPRKKPTSHATTEKGMQQKQKQPPIPPQRYQYWYQPSLKVTENPFSRESTHEIKASNTVPKNKPEFDATADEEMQHKASNTVPKNKHVFDATADEEMQHKASNTVPKNKPVFDATADEEMQHKQKQQRYRPSTSLIKTHVNVTESAFLLKPVQGMRLPNTVPRMKPASHATTTEGKEEELKQSLMEMLKALTSEAPGFDGLPIGDVQDVQAIPDPHNNMKLIIRPMLFVSKYHPHRIVALSSTTTQSSLTPKPTTETEIQYPYFAQPTYGKDEEEEEEERHIAEVAKWLNYKLRKIVWPENDVNLNIMVNNMKNIYQLMGSDSWKESQLRRYISHKGIWKENKY